MYEEIMSKPKRNKNVKICPNAYEWMKINPDAARNLKRIIKFMGDKYVGSNQGYINRAANFVEYRYDSIEGEPHFKHIKLIARQKHVVVRFNMLTKYINKGIWTIKTLKDANGNNSYVLDFPIAVGSSFDKLEKFLHTTKTFSQNSATPIPKKSIDKIFPQTLSKAKQEAADELAKPIISEEDARQRELRAVFLRRGQEKFRKDLINAYKSRCAVTGCNIVEILEAAHIIPYRGEHTNRCNNGLLLRADIHTLFDLGLL